MPYRRRLLSRARKETAHVWNSYRIWFVPAAVGGGMLSKKFVFGAIPVNQLVDLTLNGIAGGAFAYFGSLLISLVRAPGLLDRERQQKEDASLARIKELEDERPYFISKPFPSNLGNAALKKQTLQLVLDIKDIYIRQKAKQEESLYSRTPDALHSGRQYMQLETEHGIVYSKHFEASAVLLRDEILARLPEEVRKKPRIDSPMGGMIQYRFGRAGVFRLQDIAEDLDILAHLIPDSSARLP
jgi:hypothetical protein